MPSCNPDFHSIHSYQEASDRLANAKPFPETQKGYPHAKYRLEATRKRHMNIRLMSVNDLHRVYDELYADYNVRNAQWELNAHRAHIALQLYSTDVVVWRDDNVIILDPYCSNSTNAFVSRCMPQGLSQHYEPQDFLVGAWACGQHDYRGLYAEGVKMYRIDSRRRVGFYLRDVPEQPQEWTPLPDCGLEPWSVPVVDQKAARAALKAENFAEFRVWALGYASMAKLPYEDTRTGEAWMHQGEMIMKYRARDWTALGMLTKFWPESPARYARSYGFSKLAHDRAVEAMARDPMYLPKRHAANLIDGMRLAIYEAYGVVRHDRRDYLNSYGAVQNFRRLDEKYFWVRS